MNDQYITITGDRNLGGAPRHLEEEEKFIETVNKTREGSLHMNINKNIHFQQEGKPIAESH